MVEKFANARVACSAARWKPPASSPRSSSPSRQRRPRHGGGRSNGCDVAQIAKVGHLHRPPASDRVAAGQTPAGANRAGEARARGQRPSASRSGALMRRSSCAHRLLDRCGAAPLGHLDPPLVLFRRKSLLGFPCHLYPGCRLIATPASRCEPRHAGGSGGRPRVPVRLHRTPRSSFSRLGRRCAAASRTQRCPSKDPHCWALALCDRRLLRRPPRHRAARHPRTISTRGRFHGAAGLRRGASGATGSSSRPCRSGLPPTPVRCADPRGTGTQSTIRYCSRAESCARGIARSRLIDPGMRDGAVALPVAGTARHISDRLDAEFGANRDAGRPLPHRRRPLLSPGRRGRQLTGPASAHLPAPARTMMPRRLSRRCARRTRRFARRRSKPARKRRRAAGHLLGEMR